MEMLDFFYNEDFSDTQVTHRTSWSCSTPTSYSGGSRFKSDWELS